MPSGDALNESFVPWWKSVMSSDFCNFAGNSGLWECNSWHPDHSLTSCIFSVWFFFCISDGFRPWIHYFICNAVVTPLTSGHVCIAALKTEQSHQARDVPLCAWAVGVSGCGTNRTLPVFSWSQHSLFSSATSCGRLATRRRLPLCFRPWSTSPSSNLTACETCPPKCRYHVCLHGTYLSLSLSFSLNIFRITIPFSSTEDDFSEVLQWSNESCIVKVLKSGLGERRFILPS